jgi:hypothetical protein
MKTRSVNFRFGTLNAKTNPLTKLRFKPQVSAAFGSVSILIHADWIDLGEKESASRQILGTFSQAPLALLTRTKS